MLNIVERETSSKNGKNSLKSHAQSKNPTTRRATLERLEERRLLSISKSGAIQNENESELYANECYVADPNHAVAPLILNTAGSGWTNNFIYDPNQPLFKDILNEDYTLADNSQAIDIGSANIVA